jgi:hypothetical protein
MFEFRANALGTKWEEFRESFDGVRVREAFHKLVDRADRIRPHVRACVVEDHPEN